MEEVKRPLNEAARANLRATSHWHAPCHLPAHMRVGCANPDCVNLAGDSEAALPTQACGRCGGVRYCCKQCQRDHWQQHKEACKRGS